MELIMKVAVLGAAGGIGQALALLLKNRLPAGSELSLYDIAPVTPGVAADLSHIPTDVKVKVSAVKIRARLWSAPMSC
jgi:malate dehydrogenase